MSDATQKIFRTGFLLQSSAATDTSPYPHLINDSSASSIVPITTSWQSSPKEKVSLSICTPKTLKPSKTSGGPSKMKGTCSCGKPYNLNSREVSRADRFGKKIRCQCGTMIYEGRKHRYDSKKKR